MKYYISQRKYEDELLFDLAKIPFSRSGSYMALSLAEEKDKCSRGLYLKTVRGNFSENRVFLFEILGKGEAIPFHINIFPEELHIESSIGYADLCLPDLNT